MNENKQPLWDVCIPIALEGKMYKLSLQEADALQAHLTNALQEVQQSFGQPSPVGTEDVQDDLFAADSLVGGTTDE